MTPLAAPLKGWTYAALNGCTSSTTSGTYLSHHDTVLVDVGPFVMQIDSTGTSGATVLPQRLIDTMVVRATAVVDGSAVLTEP